MHRQPLDLLAAFPPTLCALVDHVGNVRARSRGAELRVGGDQSVEERLVPGGVVQAAAQSSQAVCQERHRSITRNGGLLLVSAITSSLSGKTPINLYKQRRIACVVTG